MLLLQNLKRMETTRRWSWDVRAGTRQGGFPSLTQGSQGSFTYANGYYVSSQAQQVERSMQLCYYVPEDLYQQWINARCLFNRSIVDIASFEQIKNPNLWKLRRDHSLIYVNREISPQPNPLQTIQGFRSQRLQVKGKDNTKG